MGSRLLWKVLFIFSAAISTATAATAAAAAKTKSADQLAKFILLPLPPLPLLPPSDHRNVLCFAGALMASFQQWQWWSTSFVMSLFIIVALGTTQHRLQCCFCCCFFCCLFFFLPQLYSAADCLLQKVCAESTVWGWEREGGKGGKGGKNGKGGRDGRWLLLSAVCSLGRPLAPSLTVAWQCR